MGGIGVVGVGLGSYFGVTASGAWNNSKNECSTTSCPNHAQAVVDHDSAMNNGLASTISFAAGGALLAGGILLFVLAPSGDKTERAGALSITPTAGPGVAGMSLSGSFR
jgi:serine/threonine-protein kinase